MTLNFRGMSDRRIRKYGHGRYRVIADGREIQDVFYYDGRRRIIGVLLRNAEGHFYLNDAKDDAVRKFIKARRVRLVTTKKSDAACAATSAAVDTVSGSAGGKR